MIRAFKDADIARAKAIHAENGLPECCFPDLTVEVDGEEIPNALFVERAIYEINGVPAMMCFLKVRSELYFLIDHNVGSPQERFGWLKDFKDYMVRRAWELGLDQMTAFVPNDIDESFSKRLKELGFHRSSYHAYSLNVE